MTTKAKLKLVIYAISLVFFTLGVAALRWTGNERTVGLAVSFAGLIAVALIQTIRNRKKR
ncbi:MAG: hypothetical protein IKU92_02620 [Rikenellaceae bacterium]|nr:hypothetical protein [Rikenellaceae bacterium]MBR5135921.1 hypothetical protein [Rikenellaceae bacterium]